MRRLVALALVWTATTARAQPVPSQGAQLFEEGRALAKQGKWAEACDKFTRSYAIDPAAGTALNLGDCHEHLGHLAEAWRRFEGAASQFDTAHDDRAKFARERRDALASRLGIVVIHLADPSVQVTVGGRAEPAAAEMTVHVDPGDVEIHAGAVTRHATVQAGGTTSVDIAAAAPPPSGSTLVRRRDRVWIAYTLGGIGGLTGVLGVSLGLVGRSRYNAQFPAHCMKAANGDVICDSSGFSATQDAITMADFGTAFGIVSVLSLGASAVVYFTAPRERVVVSPTASRSGAGLVVSGSF